MHGTYRTIRVGTYTVQINEYGGTRIVKKTLMSTFWFLSGTAKVFRWFLPTYLPWGVSMKIYAVTYIATTRESHQLIGI